jgi:hypothetical protein
VAERAGWLALIGALLAAPVVQAEEPVAVVGVYSNNIVADKQAQGYYVQLWREGEQYFGFFFSSMGLNEDMPMGILENVRFDSGSRTLSFKSRLSVGSTTMNGETWTPTRDVYQFEGTLFPEELSGSLIHTDALQPTHPATQELIKLYRDKQAEAALPAIPSYQVWTELARKLLQERGPKW